MVLVDEFNESFMEINLQHKQGTFLKKVLVRGVVTVCL